MQSNNNTSDVENTKKPLTSENVFKYINIVLVLILIFCIKGFLQFRIQSIEKGYHVFSVDALIWCAVGFCIIFIVKYAYYALMKGVIDNFLNSKYIGEERVYKVYYSLKLSFDSIFYLLSSIMAYALFSNQYWFPSMAGGQGSCGQIYKEYPNWPTDKRRELEMFLMLQLGVHAFSVFQMIVIKRKTERKFYQLLLHHFVAATLILFSMMCNEVAAGTMVLIVHDASDVLMAYSRWYIESKFVTKKLMIFTYVSMVLVWIYLRIITFPVCLLANVYVNKPLPSDEWYIINFQYNYLLFMAFVLFGMHIFWTYFIIKVGIKAANKGTLIVNTHANKTKE